MVTHSVKTIGEKFEFLSQIHMYDNYCLLQRLSPENYIYDLCNCLRMYTVHPALNTAVVLTATFHAGFTGDVWLITGDAFKIQNDYSCLQKQLKFHLLTTRFHQILVQYLEDGDIDNGREFDVQEFCNCMNDHKVWPRLGCGSEASFRERHKLNFAGFWFTEYSWYLSYKENTPGINLSAKHPTSFYNLLREGCTKKNPEKVWSFAKPPPGPPPPPRFGIFMKNIKFQCVFWPFLGHF